MSYDLHFVPPEAGEEPDEVSSYLEDDCLENEDGQAAPKRVSKFPKEEVAAALLQVNPALQRFQFDFEQIASLSGISVEEARRQNDHIELNAAEKTGIQITLFSGQASITVPYWHVGSSAEPIFEEVGAYADAIVECARYRIFDPQLGLVVDEFDELEAELRDCYDGAVRRLPGTVAASANSKKPWWRFW